MEMERLVLELLMHFYDINEQLYANTLFIILF